MSDHLSISVLQQLSQGLLADAELARCEAHVARCDSCRAELAAALRVAPSTGTVGKAASSVRPPVRAPRGAAAAALDRVIYDEQARNARYAIIIRVVLTVLASILWFLIPLKHNNVDALWFSKAGTFAYCGVALVVAVVFVMVPAFRVPSLYGIALLDVPIISAIHHTQIGTLGVDRWMNAPINLIMMFSLIVLSILSLSWIVICLTVMTAAASMIAMLYRCECEPMSIALTALMLPVVAGVTSMLVLRIRSLVRASRQRDLLGKYILGPRLGAGGMAEVFSATYSPEGGFERQVAVKRILPSFSSDPSAIALFRREAELGATLAHPNLVHVLDFGSDGDTYFLAMEFVDGANLGDLCADNRKHGRGVEPLVVAYIAWCLADALEHVHEHVSPSGQHLRLVHRDLNPPNILISRSGDVKLADFGIIREVAGANLTQAGLMRGKLPYAAPEQIERDQIDGRADLFALGITLWELLAGRRLFTGANDAEIARALLSMPVPALHELAPAAPQALIAIIDGLLERDLEHRTPSAQALRQQLGALPTDLLDIRAGRARLAAIVTLIAQKRANTALVRGDKSDETTTEMRPHSA